MKNIILAIAVLLGVALGGKETHLLVVKVEPRMHCENCEKKIKGNLRFEKGVKEIVTSIPDQTVAITYDASKTSADALVKALKKIGYTATVVSDTRMDKRQDKKPKR